MPLFLFVILFGLSMDYHVFVVSRIKEAHDSGMPTRAAVAHGITSTAGVVTSAAVIRAVLLPSVMTLLGEANWYLPRALGRLPELGHGGRPPLAPPTAPAPARAAATAADR